MLIFKPLFRTPILLQPKSYRLTKLRMFLNCSMGRHVHSRILALVLWHASCLILIEMKTTDSTFLLRQAVIREVLLEVHSIMFRALMSPFSTLQEKSARSRRNSFQHSTEMSVHSKSTAHSTTARSWLRRHLLMKTSARNSGFLPQIQLTYHVCSHRVSTTCI